MIGKCYLNLNNQNEINNIHKILFSSGIKNLDKREDDGDLRERHSDNCSKSDFSHAEYTIGLGDHNMYIYIYTG